MKDHVAPFVAIFDQSKQCRAKYRTNDPKPFAWFKKRWNLHFVQIDSEARHLFVMAIGLRGEHTNNTKNISYASLSTIGGKAQIRAILQGEDASAR